MMRRSVGVGLAVWLAGCVGLIGGDDHGEATAQLECQGDVDVGESPLRRLTRQEYDNAVRDLLGDVTRPARNFVEDERIAGFAANAVAPVTELELSDYFFAAEELAAQFVIDQLPAWSSCDIAQSSCAKDFLTRFGRRAYRRPLSDSQLADLMQLYEGGRNDWNATVGIELSLHAMLMSPHFIYHLVLGGGDGNVTPLTSFELASRLGFYLWHSVPDDELLDRAEDGTLGDDAVLAQQIERMFHDARARDATDALYAQWLEIDTLTNTTKSAELFPEWNDQLASALRDETLMFARHLVHEGDGSLTGLFTSPERVIDATLADFYGVPAPQAGWGLTTLDPDTRAGILTHGSVLSSHAHANEASWVQRGLFVRRKMLCETLPPPPADVMNGVNNNPDRVENSACSGCHRLMDPIGKGFDRYDSIGRFRTADVAGQPIDGVGEVVGTGDASGPFDGLVQLGSRLASSEQVRDCVAKHYYRFAVRRLETERDGCTLAILDDAFAGGDLRQLVIAIAKSPAFRHRRVPSE